MQPRGTKAAAYAKLRVAAGGEVVLRLRLTRENETAAQPFADFDAVFAQRIAETDAYYGHVIDKDLSPDRKAIARQAYAGMLWSKQFYQYIVYDWLEGDAKMPPPPGQRKHGRNADWSSHLFNRDVISMPDKWEYPWYAAWDLAFHTIPLCRVDPQFAKQQLVLFLREWYLHPNGQMPAYEWALGDVNPPVHAWACWRVYKMTAPRGRRDRVFLARCFEKLLLNFTWWVNRKDAEGNHVFSGGFLGLDNIGVFDRSQPLPTGGRLQQADATAWMAFYCNIMLAMALELAGGGGEAGAAGHSGGEAAQDMASKFFEHFVHIADAMNSLGGTGLWDEQDGFYYDQLLIDGHSRPLRVRSLVGLMPLIACSVLEYDEIKRLRGFRKRMAWFMQNRQDLAKQISYLDVDEYTPHPHYLLAIPSRERLQRVLRYMLDEGEFLSPFGIRSLSKVHEREPYVFHVNGSAHTVRYVPGESDTTLFGGNSNWRGPVWFPVNYLIVEALERYHHFYGDDFQVECPTGSGRMMNLRQVACELYRRLVGLFERGGDGRRPCFGSGDRFADDPHFRDLLLFHEYFHAETGTGLGASHQTGWTGLVTQCLENV